MDKFVLKAPYQPTGDQPQAVIAHNKTLAAQLYGEFKEMFPDNAVEYFVSYYFNVRKTAYFRAVLWC